MSKKEIPDHVLVSIVHKVLTVLPDDLPPLAVIIIARNVEREYFKRYLAAFPAHIDQIIETEASIFHEFIEELKKVADVNMQNYKRGGQ